MMARRQRSTLVADITQELRQMILTGKVQPGEFLPSRKDLAAFREPSLRLLSNVIFTKPDRPLLTM